MKRNLLVWCSQMPETTVFQRGLLDAFGSSDEHWDILSPAEPDFVERAGGYDGYLIGGSEKSLVRDADTPLVRRLLAFLSLTGRRTGTPVIGICFGAQALAVSQGGTVGSNPSGQFRLGVEKLEFTEHATATGWREFDQDAVIAQCHGEAVLTLPDDATVLARSEANPHEIFLIGNCLLGIQGHPETTNVELRDQLFPLYRRQFAAEHWRTIEQECEQPLCTKPVVALARRLMKIGRIDLGGPTSRGAPASELPDWTHTGGCSL